MTNPDDFKKEPIQPRRLSLDIAGDLLGMPLNMPGPLTDNVFGRALLDICRQKSDQAQSLRAAGPMYETQARETEADSMALGALHVALDYAAHNSDATQFLPTFTNAVPAIGRLISEERYLEGEYRKRLSNVREEEKKLVENPHNPPHDLAAEFVTAIGLHHKRSGQFEAIQNSLVDLAKSIGPGRQKGG